MLRTTLSSIAAIALCAIPATAKDFDVGPMHISQPWARATPKGASVAGAYLTVTNKGTAPDRLTCVSAEVGKECQIHSMEMEGDVAKMRPLAGGLEIKPGQTVELKPDSFHMMIMGLNRQLQQGQTFKATLKFEKAGNVAVEFAVEGLGATGADPMGGMNMSH